MAIVTTNDQYYHDIADAIREMGVTGTMTPAEMAENILSIESGSDPDYTITVQTASGATVTAVKGDITVTGTAVDRVCVLHVPEAGAYTVTSTYDGTTFTRTVTASTNVDTVMNMAMITDENVNTYLRYASDMLGKWTLEDDVWSIPSSSSSDTYFEVLRDVYVRIRRDIDLQAGSTVALKRIAGAHGNSYGTSYTYFSVTGSVSDDIYFQFKSGDTLWFEYICPGSAGGDIVSMKFEICDCVNADTYSQFFDNCTYDSSHFTGNEFDSNAHAYTGLVVVGKSGAGIGNFPFDLTSRLNSAPSKYLVRVNITEPDDHSDLCIYVYNSQNDSDGFTQREYVFQNVMYHEYMLTVNAGQRISINFYQEQSFRPFSATISIEAQRYY